MSEQLKTTEEEEDREPSSEPLVPQRRRREVPLIVMRVGLLVGVLALWELLSGTVIDPFWFSSPSNVVEWCYDWIINGDFWRHFSVTMQEALGGFVIGAMIGLAAGIGLAKTRRMGDILDPFLMALNSIPRVALAPLFVVWFGIGLTSKIILVITLVFFIVFYNTYQGVRSVERTYAEVASVMGASSSTIFRKVMLPAASPWIFLGIKLSIPFALIGAIIGEFIAASAGIGWKIRVETSLYNTTGTLSGIIILMIIAMFMNVILVGFERKLLYWSPSHRSREPARGDFG